MSLPKYSPGPWKWKLEPEPFSGEHVLLIPGVCRITSIIDGSRLHWTHERMTDETQEGDLANAQLISCAPTMLSEMDRYAPILNRLFTEHPDLWHEMAEGAGIATPNAYNQIREKATKVEQPS